MNEFINNPQTDYSREYDYVETAKRNLVDFLVRMEGLSPEQALIEVNKTIAPDGEYPFSDPEVMYLHRIDYEDRVIKTRPLTEYIKDIVDNNYIMAPNMTVYVRPEVEKSVFADYIQSNMRLRKKNKRKMFIHRMRGEKQEESYYKTTQESNKLKNNSLSGLQSSPSTVGYNKSAHSSLTSLCRCATSYANSSNEKFLGGLRHYYAPGIVYNHILTTIDTCNLELVDRVVKDYNLKHPDVDDVMHCINASTGLYWVNAQATQSIREFVERLSPAERSAFMFTGDFYHFDLINQSWVENFIYELGTMVTGTCPNAKEVIDSLDDNYRAIASLICEPLIKGILLNDAETEKPEAYHAVALTSLNMQSVMAKYQPIIDAFFKQPYLPLSVAAFPSAMRKSVPTSDTDSTIFTTQYWVKKYGTGSFSQKSRNVMYAIVFMVSGMVQNTLLKYSANLGVSKSQLLQLEMKNEYIFPVYVLTSVAKHYFAWISAGEGNVYGKFKNERKGVNLRSSNAPQHINDKVGELMDLIMGAALNNQQISINEVLNLVLSIECLIRDDIMNSGFDYLNFARVNDSDSYTKGDGDSNYQSYTFWNEVFGDRYGMAPPPPYRAVKVSVNLPNRTAVANWVNSIEDPEIKQRISNWVVSQNKTSVSLFRIPLANAEASGIPAEILKVVDVREIIRQTMKPFYMTLESIGVYMSNKKGTRLVIDEAA